MCYDTQQLRAILFGFTIKIFLFVFCSILDLSIARSQDYSEIVAQVGESGLNKQQTKNQTVTPEDTTLTQEARKKLALQKFLTAVALAKNNLGAVYYANAQYDSAQAHIENALEIAPNFTAAHLTLGLIRHDKGDLTGALTAFKKTVVGDTVSLARMDTVPPDTVYTWARSQFDKLLEGSPKLAVAHTAMAIVYNQGGYLNEAIHHYRQAINDDASYMDAYTNLGKVYTDTKEYQKAVDIYKNVLKLSPPLAQLSKIHLNLGVAYMGIEQVDKAIIEWKKAIGLSPSYMDAYMNLGAAYQTKNMSDSTRIVWEQALEISPQSVLPRVALARLAGSEGRLSDAIQYYQETLEMGAEDPRIYAEIGLIREQQEDFKKAISNYKKALTLVPESAQLKSALTRIEQITEDRAKAISSNKIRVRQIVVVSREEAVGLMKLLKDGADFIGLARKNSIDSSRNSGGDLGFFGPGEMIPDFEKAAMKLEIDELSGIIETPMGFHIIKRVE